LNRELLGSVCGVGTVAAGGGRSRHYARKGNLRKNAAFYALLEQFRTTEKKRGLLVLIHIPWDQLWEWDSLSHSHILMLIYYKDVLPGPLKIL
jgi:hypothetical protein